MLIGFAVPASSASLQVAPVTIELPASAKAASLTLRDLGDMPIRGRADSIAVMGLSAA